VASISKVKRGEITERNPRSVLRNIQVQRHLSNVIQRTGFELRRFHI